MPRLPLMLFTLGLFAASLLCPDEALPGADEPKPGNRFEKEIVAMEAKDAESPPPKGAVLFLGSSSIRLWDVAKSFPETKVVNRGFGGSQIADSVHYVDRLVVRHAPRLVVFYAGDNDIATNKPPEQVLKDFQALVARIHEKLPETRIAFLSIKPSIARWSQFETQRTANAMVREFMETDKRLAYIDIVSPMLGADLMPRQELFRKDNLHLSDEGYKVWAEAVRPFLGDAK